MRFPQIQSLAFLFAMLAFPADSMANAQACDVHFFPAEKLTSVGEDFDQVKRRGQDLAMYESAAGRPLNWLTVERQIELARDERLASSLATYANSMTFHQPLSRYVAVKDEPKIALGTGCVIEIAIPQIILERGGLAARSLRLFGVARMYENGQRIASYNGFSSAPMSGFRLTEPSDIAPATAIVEGAYLEALRAFIDQFNQRKD